MDYSGLLIYLLSPLTLQAIHYRICQIILLYNILHRFRWTLYYIIVSTLDCFIIIIIYSRILHRFKAPELATSHSRAIARRNLRKKAFEAEGYPEDPEYTSLKGDPSRKGNLPCGIFSIMNNTQKGGQGSLEIHNDYGGCWWPCYYEPQALNPKARSLTPPKPQPPPLIPYFSGF